jgi:hypothetical protein
MRAERKGEIDLAADALHQAPDFREVGRHVEGAVDRANKIDARLAAGRARLWLGGAFRAEFGPQPVDGAVGRLPLVLVDSARNETQQVAALGRDTAADHFGNAARDHDGRHVRVLRRVGAAHRAFGAFAGKLLLGKARDDDWQLMRRECVGVMQHGGDRQVFAADRAVDDNPQATNSGEGVDGAPVAAGAVVVED